MRTVSALAAIALTLAASPLAAQPAPPPLAVTQLVSQPGVLSVQQRLQQQGVYTGRVDGLWGTDSQAALERFQQTHGLQVTGQLNQATMATLGLTPDQVLAAAPIPAPAVPVVPVAGSGLTTASVQTIQSRLKGLNFYPGAVDGLWGASTEDAIQHFQQSRGLQPNGQLNPATITALGLDPNAMIAR